MNEPHNQPLETPRHPASPLAAGQQFESAQQRDAA